MNLLVIGESWPAQGPTLKCIKTPEAVNARATRSTFEVWENDLGWWPVDAVLWRCQFDADLRREVALLEMIDFTGVPCINSASTNLRFGGRISSHTVLRRGGLPVVEQELWVGRLVEPTPPIGRHGVIKVGNYHMGFGKGLARTEAQWRDLVDVAIVANDFIAVEPHLSYVNDVRCLVVGERIVGVERVPRSWKANDNPIEVRDFTLNPELKGYIRRAVHLLQADVVGLDFLRLDTGQWILLEANLSPGLSTANGDSLRSELFELVRRRV